MYKRQGYAGQFGWKYGIASTWIGVGNAMIGSLLAWVILGRRTRIMTQHLDSATMPEFFGARFGSKSIKIGASMITFIFLIPYTASLYNGLSRLFGMAFHIDYTVCIIIMAAVSYTHLDVYKRQAWKSGKTFFFLCDWISDDGRRSGRKVRVRMAVPLRTASGADLQNTGAAQGKKPAGAPVFEILQISDPWGCLLYTSMDEAASRIRVRSMTVPAHLQALDEEVRKVCEAKKKAAAAQEYEQAAVLRDKQKALSQELKEKQEQWRNGQNAAVTAEDVAEVVSAWTNIPVTMLTQDERQRLRKLEETLHKLSLIHI